MTVIRDQSPKVKYVDAQQEIEQHEKELKSLLSRVLKEPLSDKLSEFGGRLDALEGMADDLHVAHLAASTNIQECISKISALAIQQKKLSDIASDELAKRLETTRTQLTKDLSEAVVGNIIDTIGRHLAELETKMKDGHSALVKGLDVWQSDQVSRHRELQERVSTQLTAVGKSIRAMQLATLCFAVIGAAGVVMVLVRSLL